MKKYLILIFSFAILLSVANVANAGISLPFPGCTDPVALNYNPLANIDDGSCTYFVPVLGCTDPVALNYNPLANIDDGSCTYFVPVLGCTDPVALNYNPLANIDDGSCIFLPTDIEQCKKYDWEIFEIFRNQGDCVSFIATDGRKLIKGN